MMDCMKIQQNEEKQNNYCIISDDIVDLLSDILSEYMYNHQLYTLYASEYKNKGLNQLYKYYIERACNEIKIYDKIVKYMNLSNCDITCEIALPYTSDEECPIERTLRRDLDINSKWKEIYTSALEVQDYTTVAFASKRLLKRIKDISISSQACLIMKQEGSMLSKEKIILNLYESYND